MLEIRQLTAGYDKAQILHQVTLAVAPGEVVGLLGRNGSGRSTLLKAIMGLVNAGGYLAWKQQSMINLPVHEIARKGIAWVPENREVFAHLTVQQNLDAGWRSIDGGKNRKALERQVFDLFPRLFDRRHVLAGVLSGGEQQMLSMGRALMTQPALLLLDEPAEGLAVPLRERLALAVQDIAATGVAILLVEQKLHLLPGIVSRVAVMGAGEIRFDGSMQDFVTEKELRQRWLEI